MKYVRVEYSNILNLLRHIFEKERWMMNKIHSKANTENVNCRIYSAHSTIFQSPVWNVSLKNTTGEKV